MIDFNVETGPEKKRPSVAELVNTICAVSSCVVTQHYSYTKIVFGGPVKDIPSLKNTGHVAGRGRFLDRATLAKLKAMDRLFFEAKGSLNIDYSSGPVSMVISNAARRRSFDTDNTLSTVRDWLEPSTKTSGQKAGVGRGWGIGIVSNDSFISGGSFHASELGWDLEKTEIVIVPWAEVSPVLKAYAEKHRR
jgi:hypothetical protein